MRGAGRRGLLGRVDARQARARAPRREGPDRRRGALDRRRGRRPLPRRARRAAARRACRTRSSSEVADAMLALVRRYARTHGPFPTAQLSAPLRRRPDPGAARARARRRAGPRRAAARRHRARVVRRRRPAPACGAPASPHLRHEAEAVDPAELARFLPAGRTSTPTAPPGAGPDRLREALVPLQGVALTPEVWERDVLPRRLGAYSPTWLDELTAPAASSSGSAPGALARDRPGGALLPRGRAPRRPAAGERQARAARGRGPRRDPRAARPPRRPSGSTSSPTSTSPPRSSTRRSGTSPGPAR